MTPRPTVSVVSPVYNAADALDRLVRSLRAQTYARDRIEIILVDNNSTDGSWEWIAARTDIVGLQQTAFQTPGATRNMGFERATGEIIALIDADCWAHPRWLERGVARLLDNGHDRVAGRVAFVFSSRPNIYEVFDSGVNFQQRDFVAQKWSGTGNLFLRRELIAEIGALDPTLRSAEDCEFGLRASARGKSLGFAPEAVVYHHTRRTFWSLFRKFIRTGYGCGQLYRKYGHYETSVFYRKANYRPVHGTWRDFARAETLTPRVRTQIDFLWNAFRMASNIGNFAGYFDLSRVERGRNA